MSVESDERLHDEAQQRADVTPWLDAARAEIVDTVMGFAQYPQPVSAAWMKPRKQEFDLATWIVEELDPLVAAQFMACGITDYSGEFDERRFKVAETVKDALIEHFTDHELTISLAERMRDDAKEDQ